MNWSVARSRGLDPEEARKNFTRFVETGARTVRTEVIEVKGGKPVTVEVRETRHGPIMTEFFPGVGEEVALREALEETGIVGLALHPTAPRPREGICDLAVEWGIEDRG